MPSRQLQELGVHLSWAVCSVSCSGMFVPVEITASRPPYMHVLCSRLCVRSAKQYTIRMQGRLLEGLLYLRGNVLRRAVRFQVGHLGLVVLDHLQRAGLPQHAPRTKNLHTSPLAHCDTLRPGKLTGHGSSLACRKGHGNKLGWRQTASCNIARRHPRRLLPSGRLITCEACVGSRLHVRKAWRNGLVCEWNASRRALSMSALSFLRLLIEGSGFRV